MKAYVVTTGLVFVLILAAHVARVIAEGTRLMREPSFIFTSALALVLAGWAWLIFRQLSRPDEKP